MRVMAARWKEGWCAGGFNERGCNCAVDCGHSAGCIYASSSRLFRLKFRVIINVMSPTAPFFGGSRTFRLKNFCA
jgi:hypothetical protein